ncbi:unnamed protein product [Larinioides sclopetarius]|uniref:Uncharacterized protein n=1 Tax=Larinioides sclopetarius TaxID=280406 RepID=A0AAV1ZUS9_9ARAC
MPASVGTYGNSTPWTTMPLPHGQTLWSTPGTGHSGLYGPSLPFHPSPLGPWSKTLTHVYSLKIQQGAETSDGIYGSESAEDGGNPIYSAEGVTTCLSESTGGKRTGTWLHHVRPVPFLIKVNIKIVTKLRSSILSSDWKLLPKACKEKKLLERKKNEEETRHIRAPKDNAAKQKAADDCGWVEGDAGDKRPPHPSSHPLEKGRILRILCLGGRQLVLPSRAYPVKKRHACFDTPTPTTLPSGREASDCPAFPSHHHTPNVLPSPGQ